jgi:hypothetical protein
MREAMIGLGSIASEGQALDLDLVEQRAGSLERRDHVLGHRCCLAT